METNILTVFLIILVIWIGISFLIIRIDLKLSKIKRLINEKLTDKIDND